MPTVSSQASTLRKAPRRMFQPSERRMMQLTQARQDQSSIYPRLKLGGPQSEEASAMSSPQHHVRGRQDLNSADGLVDPASIPVLASRDVTERNHFHQELPSPPLNDDGLYVHARARGRDRDDYTSYLYSQKHWGPSEDARPEILFQLHKADYQNPLYEPQDWICPWTGTTVLDHDTLRNYKAYRDIPSQLSSHVEPWLMVAIDRTDSRIGLKDFMIRIRPASGSRLVTNEDLPEKSKSNFKNRFQVARGRYRTRHGLTSWENRQGTKQIAAEIESRLTAKQLADNTVRGLPPLDPWQVDRFKALVKERMSDAEVESRKRGWTAREPSSQTTADTGYYAATVSDELAVHGPIGVGTKRRRLDHDDDKKALGNPPKMPRILHALEPPHAIATVSGTTSQPQHPQSVQTPRLSTITFQPNQKYHDKLLARGALTNRRAEHRTHQVGQQQAPQIQTKSSTIAQLDQHRKDWQKLSWLDPNVGQINAPINDAPPDDVTIARLFNDFLEQPCSHLDDGCRCG